MRYRLGIAPHWYDLGLQLLQKKYIYKLYVIKANHIDVEECCDKMFKYWLEVDTKANWNKLIDALENIDLYATAATIRKDNLIGKFY